MLGRGATQFRLAAERALAECEVVALDLAGVRQMDAHGVGVLAGLYGLSRDTGRTLLLADVSKYVRRLLQLTGLDDVIPTVTRLDAKGKSHRRPGTMPVGRQEAASPHGHAALLHGTSRATQPLSR